MVGICMCVWRKRKVTYLSIYFKKLVHAIMEARSKICREAVCWEDRNLRKNLPVLMQRQSVGKIHSPRGSILQLPAGWMIIIKILIISIHIIEKNNVSLKVP